MYLVNNFKDIITKKYFCFEGNAARQEFWMFFLAVAIINAILGVIPGTTGRIVQGVFSLAILLPFLGVGARRMHDIGKSGWMQLLGLIPCVGAIILIVLWAKPGQTAEGGCGCGCSGEGEQK